MKQTAVDWLLEQLDEQVYTIDYFQNRINISISLEDMQAIKKEAKEMEKEQIEDAYEFGGSNQYAIDYLACQYYQETYEQK
jgi:hypothetical protein